MTEHPGTRVTVVVVAAPGQDGEDGPLLRCVHSVEQQTYPRDLVDVHIVNNAHADPLAEMQAVGVAHADTDLVAFISPTQTWEPTVLAELVEGLLETPGSSLFGGTGLGADQRSYGTVMKKSYYMQHREQIGAV